MRPPKLWWDGVVFGFAMGMAFSGVVCSVAALIVHK